MPFMMMCSIIALTVCVPWFSGLPPALRVLKDSSDADNVDSLFKDVLSLTFPSRSTGTTMCYRRK